MPQISRFLGIEIHIRYHDHPPPHFHVRYGENRATIAIDTLQIADGSLPPRVYGLVVEWGLRHQARQRDNWRRAAERQPLHSIPPLE